MNRKILVVCATIVASSFGLLVACSDDSTTNPTTPFSPAADAGPVTQDANVPATDGGCPNKPAGCFCGTPTTQAQFLNRCTNSTALEVKLTVPPATTANIP